MKGQELATGPLLDSVLDFLDLEFFFTRVTGPSRSLSLKLIDTRVYEPQIRPGVGGKFMNSGVLQGYLAHKKTPTPLGPP